MKIQLKINYSNCMIKKSKKMPFIICSRKKSMPKVSIAICKKCPRLKNCPDYNLFRQPLLFPDINKEGLYTKKRKKRFKTQDNIQTSSHEVQLPLSFTGNAK